MRKKASLFMTKIGAIVLAKQTSFGAFAIFLRSSASLD